MKLFVCGKLLYFLLAALFFIQIANSQSITAKIVEFSTGESIPYANILVNNSESLISNAEGYFTLSENSSDSNTLLVVSYLGFVNKKLTVGELKEQRLIIKLQAAIIELNEVTISNKKLSPDEIMANVKANLERNYKKDGQATMDKIFFRTSTNFKPSKLDVEIEKSTGFSKETLKKANTQMSAFTSKLISQPPKEYTDVLCHYFTFKTQKDNKPYYLSKLDVMKATKLKNENSSASLEELEKSTRDIMLTHLDTSKYYRIKSGLFGSRDTISLRKEFNQRKKKVKTNQLTATKASLSSFLSETSLLNKKELEFINDTEIYDYVYEGATYSNDYEIVYILSFKPKKNRAIYKGKLYISESDFAVIRTEFSLAEGKKVSGFNMKFLLGVKTQENVSNGTLIFKKNPIGEGYYMHYAAKETGQYIYVNRPIKFIELTDSEKDVVAFEMKIEANTITKTELLNISRTETSEATIQKVPEDNFNFIKLKSYDPKIWKEFSAIEPIEEMKKFKSVD
jgi:hypothetical protein